MSIFGKTAGGGFTSADLATLTAAMAVEGTDAAERAALIATLTAAIEAPATLTVAERAAVVAAVAAALDVGSRASQTSVDAIASDVDALGTALAGTATAAALSSVADAVAGVALQSSVDNLAGYVQDLLPTPVAGTKYTITAGNTQPLFFASGRPALVIVRPSAGATALIEYTASPEADIVALTALWEPAAVGATGSVTATTPLELAAPPVAMRVTAAGGSVAVEVAQ